MPENEWLGRARREAAVILDNVGVTPGMFVGYDDIASLTAIAWMQGVNLGSHETLAMAESAFAQLAADLTTTER